MEQLPVHCPADKLIREAKIDPSQKGSSIALAEKKGIAELILSRPDDQLEIWDELTF